MRSPSVTPEQWVALLPRRVAHAVHAMMAARDAAPGSTPVTTREVTVYDREAWSAASTGVALAHGVRYGLTIPAGRLPGEGRVWLATPKAHELKLALEDRFLREAEAPDAVE